MIKGICKKVIPLLCGLLILLSLVSNATAQEQNVVTGKMYSIYFLASASSNDVDLNQLSHMQITFNEYGRISVMGMNGDGFYLAGPGVFAASYFIVGLRMGFETTDLFIALTGISIDPFILGVGFFLIDYDEINPYVFTGFQIME